MPRCQRSGARSGNIAASSSNAAADEANLPFSNSATRAIQQRLRTLRRAAAAAEAARTQASAQRRKSRHSSVSSFRTYNRPSASAGYARTVAGRTLSRRDRLECGRRRRGQNQLTRLPHNQQPAPGEGHRAGAEAIGAPQHLAALHIHRAKHGTKLLPPVKSEQPSLVMNTGRVVIRQHVVRQPDPQASHRQTAARRRRVRIPPTRKSHCQPRQASRHSPTRPAWRATAAGIGLLRSRGPVQPAPRA